MYKSSNEVGNNPKWLVRFSILSAMAATLLMLSGCSLNIPFIPGI